MEYIKQLPITIRASRLKISSSAKEFYDTHRTKLGISYSQYIAIETGTKFPTPDFVIRLAPLIKSDPRALVHLWARDQMPDDTSREFFDSTKTGDNAAIDKEDIFIFHDHQVKDLERLPHVWELLCFIGHYRDRVKVTEKVLGAAFQLPKKVLRESLDWLLENAIVTNVGGHYRGTHKYFHIPANSNAFTGVRNSNFRILSERVLQQYTPEKRIQHQGIRFTHTARFSPTHVKIITNKIFELESLAARTPDDGDDFGSLCVAFGTFASIKGGAKK